MVLVPSRVNPSSREGSKHSRLNMKLSRLVALKRGEEKRRVSSSRNCRANILSSCTANYVFIKENETFFSAAELIVKLHVIQS